MAMAGFRPGAPIPGAINETFGGPRPAAGAAPVGGPRPASPAMPALSSALGGNRQMPRLYQGPNLGSGVPGGGSAYQYGKGIEDRISMLLNKPFDPVRPDPSMSPMDPYAPVRPGQPGQPTTPGAQNPQQAAQQALEMQDIQTALSGAGIPQSLQGRAPTSGLWNQSSWYNRMRGLYK
jgi:hypothetical protein